MNIIWTKQAYQSWLDAAEYIRKEFGQQALEKFQKNTHEWEEVLASMPQSGSAEPLLKGMRKEYRSVVINRKNKLIYTIEKEHIKIDDFWDTRREPKHQAEKLK